MIEWTCPWCGHLNRVAKPKYSARAMCARCGTADFKREVEEHQRDIDEYQDEMSAGGLPYSREDW